MSAIQTTMTEVSHAKRELDGMKRSLRSWLRYRQLNDQVLAGHAPAGRKLAPDAKLLVASARSPELEQKMATQLHTLLLEVMPGARLPNPDVRANPSAAVQLAKIALGEHVVASGMGGLMAVPIVPLAIVVGVLLAITTAIKSQADLAAERERIACIKAGACTDYGFWLKTAAIVGLGWFAWTKMGLRERVERMTKK